MLLYNQVFCWNLKRGLIHIFVWCRFRSWWLEGVENGVLRLLPSEMLKCMIQRQIRGKWLLNFQLLSKGLFAFQLILRKCFELIWIKYSSAQLEMFGGYPTLIGGYIEEEGRENGNLFQYIPEDNAWIQHPTTMRIPRSRPAVFQVPRMLFGCW